MSFSKDKYKDFEYGVEVDHGLVTVYLPGNVDGREMETIDTVVDILNGIEFDELEVMTSEKNNKLINAFIPLKRNKLYDSKSASQNRLTRIGLTIGAFLTAYPVYNGFNNVAKGLGAENYSGSAALGTAVYIATLGTALVLAKYRPKKHKDKTHDFDNLESAFKNPLITLSTDYEVSEYA